MVSLTNPVEEQNVVNRFADYVPPTANAGISYGTNNVPFSQFSTAFFGGTTSGRAIGVNGNSIKNNGELIDASGIQDVLEAEVVSYSSIRNLNALLNVTGAGGNTDIGKVGKPIADKSFYSDATLSILSNKNNPIVEVRFSDMFPVSLSSLEYNQNVSDVEYLTATIDFRYKLYEIVPIT